MKKSDLDFWQGMAAHYTKFMRRSAPVYAEICNRIRPHLTRDMNVLELASGTGQLSFPLSPYVRLWEATDVSSSMIAEAKKRTGSSRLHFSVQDAAHLPYVSETFDVVIANALHILPEPDRVLREARRVLKPGGWLFAPTFVHAGGKLARLRTWGMERTGFRIYHAFLGSGTRPARRACSACVLCGRQEVVDAKWIGDDCGHYMSAALRPLITEKDYIPVFLAVDCRKIEQKRNPPL